VPGGSFQAGSAGGVAAVSGWQPWGSDTGGLDPPSRLLLRRGRLSPPTPGEAVGLRWPLRQFRSIRLGPSALSVADAATCSRLIRRADPRDGTCLDVLFFPITQRLQQPVLVCGWA